MQAGEITALILIVSFAFTLLISYVQFHRCEECSRLFAGRIIGKNHQFFAEDDEEYLRFETRQLRCKCCGHEWIARFPVS